MAKGVVDFGDLTETVKSGDKPVGVVNFGDLSEGGKPSQKGNKRQSVTDIIANPSKQSEPAENITDWLTRVVPESVGKLPSRILQGTYEAIKGQTDPIIKSFTTEFNNPKYRASEEMQRNAMTSVKGLGAGMLQGLGFGMDENGNVTWSGENAKRAWTTDPAGSVAGLAPTIKPTVGGIRSAVNKVKAPARNRITPERQQVLALAQEKGIQLSPADVTGSRFQGLTEGMLNNIPSSAPLVQRFRERQLADFTNNALNPLLTEVGASGKTFSEVGKAAQDSSVRRSKTLDALVSRKFKKAEKLYPGEAVTTLNENAPWRPSSYTNPGEIPTTQTKNAVTKIMQEEAEVLKPLKDTEALTVLGELANTDSMSFQGVQRNLSRLKDIIRANDKGSGTGNKFQSNSTAGAFKRVVRQLENDVDAFAAEHGGAFEEAWHDARNTARIGYELFDSRRVRQVMNTDPGQLVNHFRNRNADALEIIKRAVGPKSFDQLRGAWIESLIKTNDKGQVRPGSLGQAIAKIDEGTLRQIFKPDELREIREIGNLGQTLLGAEKVAGNPSGTGQTLLTPSYFGSIGALLVSGPGGATAGVGALITPPILAKMYLSKAGRKWLTEGFKIKEGTPKADAWLRKGQRLAAAQGLTGGQRHSERSEEQDQSDSE